MRLIFKILSRLLALLTIIMVLLYSYGAHLYNEALDKQAAMDTQIKSGNGFGGEAGMKIIDSDYSSEDFFWITENLLLFKTFRKPDANGYNKDHYIWDLENKVTLPLDITGFADCVANGKLYYMSLLNPIRPKGTRPNYDTYQADLVRNTDRWFLINSSNTNGMYSKNSGRNQLVWRRGNQCKPWYYLPPEQRTPNDPPRHHFDYLSEWGWIYKKPNEEHLKQPNPLSTSGFYAIGDDLYSGQGGIWKGEALDFPAHYQDSIFFVYLDFLDEYWIAPMLSTNEHIPKFLAFLGRDTSIRRLEWPQEWKLYDAIPLPTKKGLFWSGYDYRHANPGINQTGGFIRTKNHTIHKIVHGTVGRTELSPDGCKIAFFSDIKYYKTGDSRLRIFDACNSSIQGREIDDVEY